MKQNIKLNNQSSPRRILLATAERLGDALFVTPAIHLLKQHLPDVEFDVLVFGKIVAEVFEHNPDVSQVYFAPNRKTAEKLVANYSLTINLMHEMQEKLLRNMPKTFVSIGRPTLSVPRAEQVINFVSRMLDVSVNHDDFDARYRLYPQSKDHESIKQTLIEQGGDMNNKVLVGVQLGCHRVARRSWKVWRSERHRHKKVWPVEHYIEVATRLKKENPAVRIVLTGSTNERYIAKKVLTAFPDAIDLTGRTSILELTALMDLLNVYLTHDTGSMHIACSRGTPLVALLGLKRINFTGPYPMREQYKLIVKEHVADITVDEVVQSVVAKLPSSLDVVTL